MICPDTSLSASGGRPLSSTARIAGTRRSASWPARFQPELPLNRTAPLGDFELAGVDGQLARVGRLCRLAGGRELNDEVYGDLLEVTDRNESGKPGRNAALRRGSCPMRVVGRTNDNERVRGGMGRSGIGPSIL